MELDVPAFTTENLKLINEAIADGAQRVKYTDKEVEYRSLAEMLKIRDLMRNELGLNKVKPGSRGLFGGKRIVVRHSKDL